MEIRLQMIINRTWKMSSVAMATFLTRLAMAKLSMFNIVPFNKTSRVFFFSFFAALIVVFQRLHESNRDRQLYPRPLLSIPTRESDSHAPIPHSPCADPSTYGHISTVEICSDSLHPLFFFFLLFSLCLQAFTMKSLCPPCVVKRETETPS